MVVGSSAGAVGAEPCVRGHVVRRGSAGVLGVEPLGHVVQRGSACAVGAAPAHVVQRRRRRSGHPQVRSPRLREWSCRQENDVGRRRRAVLPARRSDLFGHGRPGAGRQAAEDAVRYRAGAALPDLVRPKGRARLTSGAARPGTLGRLAPIPQSRHLTQHEPKHASSAPNHA